MKENQRKIKLFTILFTQSNERLCISSSLSRKQNKSKIKRFNKMLKCFYNKKLNKK